MALMETNGQVLIDIIRDTSKLNQSFIRQIKNTVKVRVSYVQQKPCPIVKPRENRTRYVNSCSARKAFVLI